MKTSKYKFFIFVNLMIIFNFINNYYLGSNETKFNHKIILSSECQRGDDESRNGI